MSASKPRKNFDKEKPVVSSENKTFGIAQKIFNQLDNFNFDDSENQLIAGDLAVMNDAEQQNFITQLVEKFRAAPLTDKIFLIDLLAGVGYQLPAAAKTPEKRARAFMALKK